MTSRIHSCRSRLQPGIQLGETIAVAGAVVGGQPDPEQQDLRSGDLGQHDHVRKVVVNGLQRQATQAVIGAQFQQHQRRMMRSQQVGQSFQTATAGLATDAGVDDLVLVPLAAEPSLQQSNPAFLGLQPIGCTQAVTETEDDAILRGRRALEPDEQQCQYECPAARQCRKRS